MTTFKELKEKFQSEEVQNRYILLRRFDHFTVNGEGIEKVILLNKVLNTDDSYMLKGTLSGIRYNRLGYCTMTSGTLDHLAYHLPELVQSRV